VKNLFTTRQGRLELTLLPRLIEVPDNYSEPLTIEGVFDAMECLLEALLVLHEHDIAHRDVRWPNLLPRRHRKGFVLVDLDEASAVPASKVDPRDLRESAHAPEMFDCDTHGVEVDIWGVGEMMISSAAQSELHTLAQQCRHIDPRERPSVRDALAALKKVVEETMDTS
jgi:serine/threonine protein kinase